MKRCKIILLLLLILLETGCQATPEQTPVIGKTMDFLNLVDEIDFQPFTAPAIIKSNEVVKGLEIIIDSSVTIPKTDAYSIMLISRERFGKAELDRVMDYFQPDGHWVNEAKLTKSDIVHKMTEISKNADLESDEVQDHLKQLQGFLKEAPETAPQESFAFSDTDEIELMFAYCKEADHYAVLACELNGCTFQYRRDTDEQWIREENAETFMEEKDFSTADPIISAADALSVATQALSDLGIDPYMLLSYFCKSISYQNYKLKSVGWEFCFTRDCNGLQSVFVSDWAQWVGSPDPINASPWGQEFIFITVDENGIAKFDIRNAGKYCETLFDNVRLLDFEDVLDRIKRQLVYNHSYQPDDILEYSVNVTNIELCSALINVKERLDVGRLIPAWNISYTFREKYNNELPAAIHNCHIFLNAIDGSYIEPRASIGVWDN